MRSANIKGRSGNLRKFVLEIAARVGSVPDAPHVEKRRQKIQSKLIGTNYAGLEICETECSRNVALIHIKATVVGAYSLYPSHERRDG